MAKIWVDRPDLFVASEEGGVIYVDGHMDQGAFTLVDLDLVPVLIEALQNILEDEE